MVEVVVGGGRGGGGGGGVEGGSRGGRGGALAETWPLAHSFMFWCEVVSGKMMSSRYVRIARGL